MFGGKHHLRAGVRSACERLLMERQMALKAGKRRTSRMADGRQTFCQRSNGADYRVKWQQVVTSDIGPSLQFSFLLPLY